ncbi:hypothetical protein N9M73_02530 [Rhodobacteraceae bacterium]|nr:hypothetical protein [Paracoccaceae bacterium]
MKIKTLERPVLTVSDIELSIHPYTQILATREIPFGQVRKALSLKGHKKKLSSNWDGILTKSRQPSR